MVATQHAQPSTDAAPTPALKTGRDSFLARLQESIRHSDNRLRPFRQAAKHGIREFCGPYYGTDPDAIKTMDRRPLATIHSFVTIISPALEHARIVPRFTTRYPGLHQPAFYLGLALEADLAEIQAERTFAELIARSMFGPAISKLTLQRGPIADGPDQEQEDDKTRTDWRQDTNRLWWGTISLDDYILDPVCRRRQGAAFEGDRYAINAEDARDHGYNAKVLDLMDARRTLRHGTDDKTRSLTDVQRVADELYPHLEFADIYLKREGVIVTIPADGTDSVDPLDEVEYDGPEGGPYDMLGYEWPPDNPFPIPPVYNQLDLHAVQNELARKAKDQARRAKIILGYQAANPRDAENIKNAPDGGTAPMADTANAKEFKFGGLDPEMVTAINAFQDWQKGNGPNTDILGGQNADQETLGQSEMMLARASARLDRMRGQAQQFLIRIVKRAAWYIWTGPPEPRHVEFRLSGLPEPIPLSWTFDEQTEELVRLNCQVALSAQGLDTPEQQYARTLQLVKDVALPLATYAAAQGVHLDVHTLMSDLAQKAGVTDAWRWFRRMQVDPLMGQGEPQSQQGDQTTNISVGGSGGKAPRGRPTPKPTSGDATK